MTDSITYKRNIDKLGFEIGYTLWKQGYDNSKENDMKVIRERALQAIERYGITFSNLDERGDFFIAIGKGQSVARQEDKQ